MELKDLLLDKPIGELTDEEIEKRAHLLFYTIFRPSSFFQRNTPRSKMYYSR